MTLLKAAESRGHSSVAMLWKAAESLSARSLRVGSRGHASVVNLWKAAESEGDGSVATLFQIAESQGDASVATLWEAAESQGHTSVVTLLRGAAKRPEQEKAKSGLELKNNLFRWLLSVGLAVCCIVTCIWVCMEIFSIWMDLSDVSDVASPE